MSKRYKNTDGVIVRPARQGDVGFVAGKNQVLLRFPDSTQEVADRSSLPANHPSDAPAPTNPAPGSSPKPWPKPGQAIPSTSPKPGPSTAPDHPVEREFIEGPGPDPSTDATG